MVSLSLWHVVVDTDETASKVLEIMLKEKTGRVTFMPLNRLKPKQIQFPQSSDAQPLIKKLRFEPYLSKAFEQVFGKSCVCQDLSLAASYVRSHGINAITIDGDKVDRKGAMTGGYYDIKRSRIDAIKGVRNWKPRLQEFTRNHTEVASTLHRLDAEVTQITGRLQAAQTKLDQTLNMRDPLQREKHSIQRERERLEERATKLQSDLDQLEAEQTAQQTRKEAYQQELRTPMAQGMSDEELTQIEQLAKEVDLVKKTLITLTQNRNEVSDFAKLVL